MTVRIVDTTLRDGEQRPGVALTADEKLKIARILDSMGIYQIEAGIPAMGGEEKKAVSMIARAGLKSLVAAWNRMNIKDITHSLDCDPDIIHISVPTSDIQIQKKLCISKDAVIRNLYLCLDFVTRRHNNITVGFEDASRSDSDFLLKISGILKEYNVMRVRYADTVGVLYKRTVAEGVNLLSDLWGDNIEIHAHNDLGMAVGNSLLACTEGAGYVNTTINGMGERAGNCDFLQFIKAGKRLLPNYQCMDFSDLKRKNDSIASIIESPKIAQNLHAQPEVYV